MEVPGLESSLKILFDENERISEVLDNISKQNEKSLDGINHIMRILASLDFERNNLSLREMCFEEEKEDLKKLGMDAIM